MRKLRLIMIAILVAITFASCSSNSSKDSAISMYDGWKFTRIAKGDRTDYSKFDVDDTKWQEVTIPHTARIEPYVVNNVWQGVCWYRKTLDIPNYSADKKYFIEFEAVMNGVDIIINQEHVLFNQGGYLPTVFDATPYLKSGKNLLAVRLNNFNNPTTGPKPQKDLDFIMYGGIYRNAHFIEKDKLYITNPILANKTASGGVFITTPVVAESKSSVQIKTHLMNEYAESKNITVKHSLYNEDKMIKEVISDMAAIEAGVDFEDVQNFDVENVKLWSPDAPNLYSVKTELFCGDILIDSQQNRIGFREILFKDNQLYVNGKKTYLRGVNRHQEYPYVGYAISDNAQYRDAKKIKDAGFDYIRLSHYPHSPAFMRACDELGIFVANAILGWQFYPDDDKFREHAYKQTTELMRRDRNHPCVLTWEVSLNETAMDVPFMQKLHDIAHAEYPGERVYTSGWMDDVYDIYFQARQHRIMHKDKMNFDKPYMVSEYGDWEYYSLNPILNPGKFGRTKRNYYSSRHSRDDGEGQEQTHMYNVQQSHNDNKKIPATGDSYWVMYDYNSGCQNEIDDCGLMDLDRLPKIAYYFYQSQRDAFNPLESEGKEGYKLTPHSPMVKVATFWNDTAPTDIKVYSNCDEVALYLNGKLVGKQSPDTDVNSTHLNHPPFTFKVDKFEAGELKAEAFIDGKVVASDTVLSCGKPVALKCWLDESGIAAQSGCNDVLFLYVGAVDENGTVCRNYSYEEVTFTADDKFEVVNIGKQSILGGYACAVIKIGDKSGKAKFKAQTDEMSCEFSFDIL
ncbi:MAG: glycoside hydrolase family 2 TIM barrel-domain containing protein [Rikenellaceae bacterium]